MTSGARAGGAPPILVLAGPQCHGALLSMMLGRNPAAYGIPETNLVLADTLDSMVRDMAGLRGAQLHGLARVLSELLTGEQTIASTELAWRWVLTHLHWPNPWVRDFIAARAAPRRIVECNTAVLFDPRAANRWARYAEGADIVHVTRHPRHHARAVMDDRQGAVAALMGSYDESVTPRILDPQILWVRAERAADGLLSGLPEARVHRVRFEDIAAAPEAELRRLAGRLGLDTGADAIAAMQQPEASAFAGPGPIGAHLGLPQEFLRDPHLPAPEPEVTLTGPAGWRDDAAPLHPDTLALARARGYA